MPAIAMTIVTIAAIPSSVMIVRRGVRRTLRRGRLDRAPPGIRRSLTSQASPLLRAARAPTWIASIGDTRSARQTGNGGGGERQHETERRALDEHAGLERGLHDRQREELVHDAREPCVGGEADGDAEHHADDRDLRTKQERTARQRPWRDAQRHADPDLAALRLDGAADQIERGERGRSQHQEGEDVEHLLIALRVLVDHPVRRLVGARGDGEARRWDGRAQGPRDLRLHGCCVGAGTQAQQELADPSGPAGEHLDRRQAVRRVTANVDSAPKSAPGAVTTKYSGART